MKTLTCAVIIFIFAQISLPRGATANPYLAKAGEAPAIVRVATCAISGGFIHLYAALDNGLFEKYGMKVEFLSIRGSGIALAALAADEVQFLYCAADALQSAYDADAKLLVNRRLSVPETSVAGVIEVAREQGTNIRRKAVEMIDNRFAEDLEKSGFIKELWGGDVSR